MAEVVAGWTATSTHVLANRWITYWVIGTSEPAASRELRCQLTCSWPPWSAGTSGIEVIVGPVLGRKMAFTHSGWSMNGLRLPWKL